MGKFTLMHWIIIAVIGLVLWALFSAGKGKSETMYCRNCGFRGLTKTVTPGNIGLEIVLWIFFILPGLIYSVWRLTSRRQVCTSCHSDNVIPNDAPVALDPQIAPTPTSITDLKSCPFCAETIKRAAIVCKHCGRDLPPAKASRTDDDSLLLARPGD